MCKCNTLIADESSVCRCQHFKTTVSCADDEKLFCITALDSHVTVNRLMNGKTNW